jgi:type III secretion protein V
MRDVLEGMTEAAGQERDMARIADLTRIALKRYLMDQIARDGTVRALVVKPELETRLRDSIRLVDGVERVALPPDVARELVSTILATAEATQADALVTSYEVRRATRKLIEPDIWNLPVLAFNELTPTTRIEIIGQIGLPAVTLADPNAGAVATTESE